MLLEGVVSVAAGFIAFLYPGITILVFVTLIGVWAIITGAFEIAAAIRLRKQIKGEWLLIRLKLVKMPEGVRFVHFAGAGILGGIGFTMSLFIASLAFANPAELMTAKTGIVCASLLAGVSGILFFKWIAWQEERNAVEGECSR